MSNLETIQSKLMADATLLGALVDLGDRTKGYVGLAKGGIHIKKLKRIRPAATPEAFFQSVDVDGNDTWITRPSIVCIDFGDFPHRQVKAIPGAYSQTIRLHYYAPATQSGREAIADMRLAAYNLIDHHASGWTFASDEGPVVFAELHTRSGIHASESFPESVEDFQDYRLTSRYGNLV